MKKILLLLIILFVSNISYAENYSVHKLSNGQTVIIKQIKNNPIVTIDTWVKTGSVNETEKNTGISHFLEHLFFKGTQNHPTGEFDRILESKGAITNAATSKDFTHYYVTIASNYFDLATELHADMLLNPQIPRKELEKERKVVIEEIAKNSNVPEVICYENLVKMMYTTHPYLRRVIGSEKVVESVSREEILDYYNEFYTPSNMVTIVVGDVEPQHALEVVKKYFNTSYRKPVKKVFKQERFLTEQKHYVDYTDKETGYMLIGFRTANISDNDTYALDVLATIIGTGRTSKLYQSLKEQKQIVNSISAYNSSMRDDGLFIIKSSFVPKNMKSVEDSIYNEIEKIKTNNITETELNTAKKIIESETYYARESVSNIATEMGYIATLTGGTKYYDDYLKNISKVKAEDIQRVAEKYLVKTNSAVSVILPNGFKEKSMQSEPDDNNIKKINNFSDNDYIDKNANTKKYTLKNGMTILLNDTSYNDIIAISIITKGGDFLTGGVDKKGVSSLYGDLILKGTTKYSAKELAQTMEEKGINISTSQTADIFKINILTTKTYLAQTLEILEDIINNSVFDETELDKQKKLMLNQIKQSNDNPLKLALNGFRSEIYGQSMYNSSTDIVEKNLSKITRADIIKYKEKVTNPRNIVVSIAGNIENKSEFLNRIGNMFISSDEGQFEYGKYKIPKLTTIHEKKKLLKDQKTAWMILGWQTGGVLNLKEYATLNIINTILGSGMSSRLFVNLREAEGLAYQLGSSYSPNVLAGAFIVYVGTNPKTLEYSKQKALKEINRFKTEFVSDKELNEAKERLLGQYVIAMETNSDKADTLGWFEASGRGFKFVDEYAELIKAVTSTDIIEVANKYFNDNYVLSVVTSSN